MQPFVIVVDKSLQIQPIPAPKLSIPVGSALRVSNRNIIDDEGFAIQNHLVNIIMLVSLKYLHFYIYAIFKFTHYYYRKTFINSGTRLLQMMRLVSSLTWPFLLQKVLRNMKNSLLCHVHGQKTLQIILIRPTHQSLVDPTCQAPKLLQTNPVIPERIITVSLSVLTVEDHY